MPKPPVLPVIDWKAVFDSGRTYDQWIANAENTEKAETMTGLLAEQQVAATVAERLRSLKRPVHVVAIAEDWCGDVVRHAPVLARLAQESDQLRVRFIAREQYPDVFVRFLTNGGEAIPKFVFLNDQFVECANWGPLPEECRRLIARGKACGDVPAARAKVAALYQDDAGRQVVVAELAALIDLAATEAV